MKRKVLHDHKNNVKINVNLDDENDDSQQRRKLETSKNESFNVTQIKQVLVNILKFCDTKSFFAVKRLNLGFHNRVRHTKIPQSVRIRYYSNNPRFTLPEEKHVTNFIKTNTITRITITRSPSIINTIDNKHLSHVTEIKYRPKSTGKDTMSDETLLKIGTLTRLKYLHVRSENVMASQFISKLTNLQYLRARGFPITAKFPQLKNLYIYLRDAKSSVHQSDLRELKLNGLRSNNISLSTSRHLMTKKLKILSLIFTDNLDELEFILSDDCPDLRFLTVRGIFLSQTQIQAISLHDKINRLTLSIPQNNLQSLLNYFSTFITCSNIKRLFLIGYIPKYIDVLLENFPSLTNLIISTTADQVYKISKRCPNLTTLSLHGRNLITDTKTSQTQDPKIKFKHLKTLKLTIVSNADFDYFEFWFPKFIQEYCPVIERIELTFKPTHIFKQLFLNMMKQQKLTNYYFFTHRFTHNNILIFVKL